MQSFLPLQLMFFGLALQATVSMPFEIKFRAKKINPAPVECPTAVLTVMSVGTKIVYYNDTINSCTPIATWDSAVYSPTKGQSLLYYIKTDGYVDIVRQKVIDAPGLVISTTEAHAEWECNRTAWGVGFGVGAFAFIVLVISIDLLIDYFQRQKMTISSLKESVDLSKVKIE